MGCVGKRYSGRPDKGIRMRKKSQERDRKNSQGDIEDILEQNGPKNAVMEL